MSANNLFHALCLHFHQPRGNLLLLAEDVPVGRAEGLRIIRSYERVVHHAKKYKGVARLNVVLSSTLIEQLRDPAVIDAWRGDADLPGLLEAWRAADGIEPIATGRDRAPLPVIPREDWPAQLRLERSLLEETLGRAPKGFWPAAEMFSPEMVPALVAAGYEYVVLGADRLALARGGPIDAYAPGFLSHGGATIAVVPFDRGVSKAIVAGMTVPTFADTARVNMGAMPRASRPRLITTWTDAETEIFRVADEAESYFGVFFAPYMEFRQTGEYPLRPITLSEYLAGHAPVEELKVLGAVDPVGSVDSFDVSRWATEDARRARVARLFQVSGRYRGLRRSGTARPDLGSLNVVQSLILDAEAGDHLLWGEEWLAKIDRALDVVDALLDAAEREIAAVERVSEPRPDPAVPTAVEPEAASVAESHVVPTPEQSFPVFVGVSTPQVGVVEPSFVIEETDEPRPTFVSDSEQSDSAVVETVPVAEPSPAVEPVPILVVPEVVSVVEPLPAVELPVPVVEAAPVPPPPAKSETAKRATKKRADAAPAKSVSRPRKPPRSPG